MQAEPRGRWIVQKNTPTSQVSSTWDAHTGCRRCRTRHDRGVGNAYSRPGQQQDVRAFLDMPRAMQVPAFRVISGAQGIGKSAMLKGLLAHQRQQETWCCPYFGLSLKRRCWPRVPEIFSQLRIPFVQLMKQLKSRCLKKTGRPLKIYMQLSTQQPCRRLRPEPVRGDRRCRRRGSRERRAVGTSSTCPGWWWWTHCL